MNEIGLSGSLERLMMKIIDGFHPERILIFGSYARGEAGLDSDLDILIVKESSERPMMRRRRVLELLRESGISMDIFVLTPVEFEEEKDEVGTIAYEANHFGKVVYG